MREEVRDRLAVVSAAYGFSENHRAAKRLFERKNALQKKFGLHVDALDFRAASAILVLRDRVRNDDRFKYGAIETIERGTRKHAMNADRINFGCAGVDELVGGETNCAARVGHIVDKNRYFFAHIADERHFFYLQTRVNRKNARALVLIPRLRVYALCV